MTSTFEMVKEFHRAFELTDHTSPIGEAPSTQVRLLRIQMLVEEVAELGDALFNYDYMETLDALVDLQYFLDGTFLAWGFNKDLLEPTAISQWQFPFSPTHEISFLMVNQLTGCIGGLAHMMAKGDRQKVLAELVALQYRLNLAFEQCRMMGLKMRAFQLVHASNMAKLGPDGKAIRDASGRVVKPEGWKAPNWHDFFA